MDDLASTVKELVERRAVEEVLLRYASTIDAKDFVTLRSLFCDDIHARTATSSSTAATSC